MYNICAFSLDCLRSDPGQPQKPGKELACDAVSWDFPRHPPPSSAQRSLVQEVFQVALVPMTAGELPMKLEKGCAHLGFCHSEFRRSSPSLGPKVPRLHSPVKAPNIREWFASESLKHVFVRNNSKRLNNKEPRLKDVKIQLRLRTKTDKKTALWGSRKANLHIVRAETSLQNTFSKQEECTCLQQSDRRNWLFSAKEKLLKIGISKLCQCQR